MQSMSQKYSNIKSISSPILSEIHLTGLLGSEELLLEQPPRTDSKRRKANVGFNEAHNVWKDPGHIKLKDKGEVGKSHEKKKNI